VPDVTSLVAPGRELAALVEECCEALEPLSRRRGKAGEATGSLAAIAALPPELIATHSPPELEALRGALTSALGSREVTCVRAGDVLGDWLPAADEPLAKAQAVDLTRAVRRLGFGVEPDVRFGGPTFGRDSQVALFRAADDDPSAPSDSFSAASLLLRLGAHVAHSDGSMGEAELLHLQDHLGSALHLDPGEQKRLHAHLAWLAVAPPDTARLKKRIDALSESARHEAGKFVVSAALADGKVDADEVKSLSKIYRLLGLDAARVHADIHDAQVGTSTSDLARMTIAGTPAADVTIPQPKRRAASPPARTSGGPPSLDMAAVEAKVRESAQVAALLGGILAEDDEPRPAVTLATASPDRCIRSLDGKHSRLLVALGSQPSWTREAYERAATECGLMPDGALEVLNELAFEVCDEPLTEGDDPIETNPDVHKELVK